MLILQVEWVQNWQKANKPSVRQRSSRQFSGPSLVVDDRTSQFLFHDVRLRFSWQTGQCHHLLSMFHFVNRCFCTTREKLPLESECWTQIVVFLNRGPMFTCFQTFRNYQKLLSQSSGLLQPAARLRLSKLCPPAVLLCVWNHRKLLRRWNFLLNIKFPLAN